MTQQVTLVRHGQASVQGATYDALSPLGRQQAKTLGAYWAELRVEFDTVYIGPRRRHAETAAGVALAYRERNLFWPEPILVPELDEHDGLAVLKIAAGISEPGDGLLTGHESRDAAVKRLFGRYREIMGDWAAGGFALDGIEPWRVFRERASRAVNRVCALPGRAVAFTSGGLVAAAVGALLDLDDRRVIHLSSEVHNTGLTDLRHRAGDVGLVTFNSIPHLEDATTITRI